ncbi:FG-GAP repeat domain-containing protein [Streptomyces sp. NPDC085946]|uniref:FG-GAP repeat domain-containing protein n=1 Tax=Streptomyces sp. NPDC085946 TaxID=3365744 RepID=UPI0037D29C6B
MAAVFKAGTWSAPRRPSAKSARFTGAPQAAADALGRPAVLRDEYLRSETGSTVLDGVHQGTTTGRALPRWRDFTDDGKADLLTRSASTGKPYPYAHNGTGGFKARALAGSGFGGYRKLIAAGDLGGDGRNDLLAIDASNELWRSDGTGTGTFAPRSPVFKDWGTSYKDVVGGLDLTGDGRPDLVTLDEDGRARLNRGKGQGGFDGRSQTGRATDWSDIRIS